MMLMTYISDIWYSYCKVLSYFSFYCLVRYLAHIISFLAPSWYFPIHSSLQLVCVMVCNIIFGQRDFLSFRGNRNVFWLILKVSIDYFILGKFQWTMCIFKVFKDFWQYYPPKRQYSQVANRGGRLLFFRNFSDPPEAY